MKAGMQVEDHFAMLNCYNAASGETATVSQAIHLVQNRRARIARAKKVGM